MVHIFGQCFNGHGGLTTPLSRIRFAPQVEQLARGVQLFFIISGFVLGLPFLQHFQDGRPAVKLRKFYKRRLTRLEPPYILSLILYAFAFVVFRHRAVIPTLVSALYSGLYIHNFFPMPSALNNVTWTLEIEVEFYIITPLIALLFAIPNIILRRATIVAAAAACTLFPQTYFRGFYLPGQLPFFFVGFLLADLRVFQQTARHFIWDIISIVLWSVVFLIPGSWGYGPLAIALAGAFALSLRGPVMRWFLSRRPIAIMGGMCYSLYLVHMLVMEMFFPLTRHAMTFKSEWVDVLTQVVILGPIILAVGMGYYLLIERPCMNPRWPEELRQRIKQANAFADKTV